MYVSLLPEKDNKYNTYYVKHGKIVPALLITEVSQQMARLRRLEVPPNPTRGYLDPATVEQHRMIGQVRGYNQAFKHPNERNAVCKHSSRSRLFAHLYRFYEVNVNSPGVFSWI